MRRDLSLIGIISIFFIAMAIVSSVKVEAAQSYNPPYSYNQHYKWHNIQCAKYLSLAAQALKNNNLRQAKVFARLAIQSDAHNKTAWQTYDGIISKITNSGISVPKQNKSLSTTKSHPETTSSKPKTPSSTGAFEGC